MARLFVNGRWEDVNADDYYVPPPSGQGPYAPSSATLGTLPEVNRPARPYTPYTPAKIPNTGGATPNFRPFPAMPGGSATINRSPSQPYPALPPLPGRSNATPAPPYTQRSATSDAAARRAISGLRSIKLPSLQREPGAAAPSRIDPATGLPAAPARVAAAPGLPALPGRGGASDLIAKLAAGVQLTDAERAQLADATGDNEWEQLALDRFRGGSMDPGTQFTGRELAGEIFSKADVNAMAQQRAAGTLRAYQDAEQLAAQAAGARGLNPQQLAALRARAAIGNAGALGSSYRDAQLEAAAANAAQAQAQAANTRANFESDINARLGLGRLGLDEASALASTGTARRGLDQARDVAAYEGEITQRGQDLDQQRAEAELNADAVRAALAGELGLREQDIGYAVEGGRQGLEGRGQDVTQRAQDLNYAVEGGQQAIAARGQDVAQRGQDVDVAQSNAALAVQQRAQDLEQQYRAAGLSAEQARARAQAELGLRDQTIAENLGLGRLDEQAREADMDYTRGNRALDVEESLGLGRLGIEAYRTEADVANAVADRTARMDMLDAQLADASLDRNTRAALEQQRLQVERELADLQVRQRESEFGRNFALDQEQLKMQAAALDEQARRTDTGTDLDYNQLDLSRYLAELQSRLGLGRLNIDYAAADKAGLFGGNQPPAPASPFAWRTLDSQALDDQARRYNAESEAIREALKYLRREAA